MTDLRNMPKYGIGTSKRDHQRHNNSMMAAAPGSYNPDDSFVKTT